MTEQMMALLSNYVALVEKVDAHVARLQNVYSGEIVCKKGCDDCCRHLALFPVEAVRLAVSFAELNTDQQQQVIQRIETLPDACPLLVDRGCVLYKARPLICRTHGFPITMEKQGRLAIDSCPKNFKQTRTFDHTELLCLEQLNQTLFAVNQHFLTAIETDTPLPERIRVCDALFMLE